MTARHLIRPLWMATFAFTLLPFASAQRGAAPATAASSADMHWVATWATASSSPEPGEAVGEEAQADRRPARLEQEHQDSQGRLRLPHQLQRRPEQLRRPRRLERW